MGSYGYLFTRVVCLQATVTRLLVSVNKSLAFLLLIKYMNCFSMPQTINNKVNPVNFYANVVSK